METWLEITGRQLIVAYFLIAGICNLTKASIDDHIRRMRAFGTPAPAAAFWTGIALQFAGSAMLALDWHPALGTILLMVFTLAATLIFHRFWSKPDPMQRNLSRIALLANVAVLGGLLLLLEGVLHGK
jgi:putative oxidoreductase